MVAMGCSMYDVSERLELVEKRQTEKCLTMKTQIFRSCGIRQTVIARNEGYSGAFQSLLGEALTLLFPDTIDRTVTSCSAAYSGGACLDYVRAL